MDPHKRLAEKQKMVAAWVHSYGDELYNWAYYKTNDKTTAEDLLQETFYAAHKSFSSFKGVSGPKTWLFKILNNKLTDYYRRLSKTVFVVQDHAAATPFDEHGNWKKNGLEEAWEEETQLLDDPDFNQTMEACLDDLPDDWREAVLLKYRLEKKSDEICQDLGITPSNYWQIIHRAKLFLKKCLEINWFNQR